MEWYDGYADYKNGAICHIVIAGVNPEMVDRQMVALIPKADWISGGGLWTLTVSELQPLALTDAKYGLAFYPDQNGSEEELLDVYGGKAITASWY